MLKSRNLAKIELIVNENGLLFYGVDCGLGDIYSKLSRTREYFWTLLLLA